MLEMCRIAAGIFLAICAFFDIKNKKLPIILFALFGIIGIIMALVLDQGLLGLMLGMIPGIILILFSAATEQQLGYGDGLMALVLGLFLPFDELCGVLLFGFFFCGLGAIVYLIIKRKGRKARLAFVPFVLCAYILQEWGYIFGQA